MYWGALSIIANLLGVVGYVPEITSIVYNVRVQVTTLIWTIWVFSGLFALAYAIHIAEPYVIMSSVVGLCLNLLTCILKIWRRGYEASQKKIDVSQPYTEYYHHTSCDHIEYVDATLREHANTK